MWLDPWVLLTSAFFHRKSATFLYHKNRYRLYFYTLFQILLTCFESLKVVLINIFVTLMMSAKLANLSSLKKKVFCNKGYDVIISVCDVTNKISSPESNYTVDVVLWPKFGNSSIPHNLNFIRMYSREANFFEGCPWFKLTKFIKFLCPWMSLAQVCIRYGLEVLHQCGKRVTTKSQKIFGANFYVCGSYRGNICRGEPFWPHILIVLKIGTRAHA